MDKFGKEVITSFSTGTNSLGYTTCYLCKDDNYVNVYIVDEVFKEEELNCLELQIPVENFKEIYKSDAYLHSLIVAKDFWNMYGHFNNNEYPYSFNIECYDSESDTVLF